MADRPFKSFVMRCLDDEIDEAESVNEYERWESLGGESYMTLERFFGVDSRRIGFLKEDHFNFNRTLCSCLQTLARDFPRVYPASKEAGGFETARQWADAIWDIYRERRANGLSLCPDRDPPIKPASRPPARMDALEYSEVEPVPDPTRKPADPKPAPVAKSKEGLPKPKRKGRKNYASPNPGEAVNPADFEYRWTPVPIEMISDPYIDSAAYRVASALPHWFFVDGKPVATHCVANSTILGVIKDNNIGRTTISRKLKDLHDAGWITIKEDNTESFPRRMITLNWLIKGFVSPVRLVDAPKRKKKRERQLD